MDIFSNRQTIEQYSFKHSKWMVPCHYIRNAFHDGERMPPFHLPAPQYAMFPFIQPKEISKKKLPCPAYTAIFHILVN